MAHHYWGDLRAPDFRGLIGSKTLALLPVGAIEQHGPHLPVSTDTTLAEGIACLAADRAQQAQVLRLPTMSVGKSDEHTGFAGVLSFDAPTLLTMIVQLGKAVAATGVRKLVILNAHGGNVPVLQLAARQLRLEAGMFCVTAGWISMGHPAGLLPPEEALDGIHGGLVETAAMLHFRPDLVDMSKARNFTPSARKVAEENKVLRLVGPVGTGWTMADLHPEGAAGNASLATPQIGAQLVEHAATRYAQLLDEVAAYDIPFEARP